jgi:hypothetical protein
MENHGGMISTRENLIRPPELSGNPTNSSSRKSGRIGEGNYEFCAFRNTSFHTPNGSLTCREILRHGIDGFTSLSREGVLRIVIALKNPKPSASFELANLDSNGMHGNHLVSDDDHLSIR